MSKKLKTPSIDISVNFSSKEKCYNCYHEVCKIYKQLLEENPDLYNAFDDDGIDYTRDGYYFNIYISLTEIDFFKKVIDKIIEMSK